VKSKFEKRCDDFASIGKSNACDSPTEPLTVKLTAWAAVAAVTDPHLAAVLAAWKSLSEAVKVGIVAMITAFPR